MDKDTFSLSDCKRAISFRMHRGGGIEDQAKDTYLLFDKRDKGNIQPRDIRATLNEYLPFPVSDQEIQEFIEIVDQHKKMNNISR